MTAELEPQISKSLEELRPQVQQTSIEGLTANYEKENRPGLELKIRNEILSEHKEELLKQSKEDLMNEMGQEIREEAFRSGEMSARHTARQEFDRQLELLNKAKAREVEEAVEAAKKLGG